MLLASRIGYLLDSTWWIELIGWMSNEEGDDRKDGIEDNLNDFGVEDSAPK